MLEHDQKFKTMNIKLWTWPKYGWIWPKLIYFRSCSNVKVHWCEFFFMFKICGHIHSVILNRSCEHSSFFVLFCGQTIISIAYFFFAKKYSRQNIIVYFRVSRPLRCFPLPGLEWVQMGLGPSAKTRASKRERQNFTSPIFIRQGPPSPPFWHSPVSRTVVF